jgi:hypothetical protein
MMSVGGFNLFNGASVTHFLLPEQSCAKENNNKTRDTRFYVRVSLAALPKCEAEVVGSALKKYSWRIVRYCNTVPGWIT